MEIILFKIYEKISFFKKAIDKAELFCYNIIRHERAGVAQWQSS